MKTTPELRAALDRGQGIRRDPGTGTILVPVSLPEAGPVLLELGGADAETLHARLTYLLAGESVSVSPGITDL